MSQPPGKHRGDSWGPREVIALVVIVAAFGLAIVGEITDHPGATIPAWVAALIAGIGLYYYKNGGDK
jgi:hypothetical protein